MSLLLLLPLIQGCSVLFEAAPPDAQPAPCGVFSDVETSFEGGITSPWEGENNPEALVDGIDLFPARNRKPIIKTTVQAGDGEIYFYLGDNKTSNTSLIVLLGHAQFHRGDTHRGVYKSTGSGPPDVVDLQGDPATRHLNAIEPLLLKLETSLDQDELSVQFSLMELDGKKSVSFEQILLDGQDFESTLALWVSGFVAKDTNPLPANGALRLNRIGCS